MPDVEFGEEKFSVDDFKRMQGDHKSKWSGKLLPYFIALLEPQMDESTELEQQAFDVLMNWNHDMSSTLQAPAIFEQYYVEFLKSMFMDELGEELYNVLIKQDLLAAYLIDKIRLTNESVWFDDVSTREVEENSADIAYRAFANTIAALSERLGEDIDEWNWGKVHTLSLAHPLGSVRALDKAFGLNKGPFPVGGSYHTVSPYSYPLNDLFHANHGASHRHIYVPGDWNSSQVILPTGISGIPASPYYMSQTDKYLNNIYNKDWFSDDMIRSGAVYRMIMSPEGN